MNKAIEAIKEFYSLRNKQHEFWDKITIQSGVKDNQAEADAMIELLNQTVDEPSAYLSKDAFEFITTFLDCKFCLKKMGDDFLKEIAEEKNNPWEVFIKNNLDVIVFYAVLNIRHPLKDKIKNFQRFAMLYKFNNAPNDDGFKIPYVFFEVAEIFARVLEGSIFAQNIFKKFGIESEEQKK